MTTDTTRPVDDNLGCWNSYVEAGKTKLERNARLMQAPEKLHINIISHVTTVFKLRKEK